MNPLLDVVNQEKSAYINLAEFSDRLNKNLMRLFIVY